MIKRFLVVLLILGLCGCLIPAEAPYPVGTKLPDTPSGSSVVPTKDRTSQPNYPIDTPQDLEETTTPSLLTPIPNTQVADDPNDPVVSPTPYIIKRFELQPGSPKWLTNFIHPEEGCNWMGVGGQIFDVQGTPVANLLVKLSGSLDGENIDMIALTGGALYLGPGGYEFKISDHPIASNEALWISILDQGGNALSDPFTISTYGSCDQNYGVLNFTEKILIVNAFYSYLALAKVDANP